MSYVVENEEVLYVRDRVNLFSFRDLQALREMASKNSRKRIRACVHGDKTDSLHEMLIVHEKSAYVRPHKHPGKSESIHIIEGLVDILLFDDSGRIEQVINMGDYASGRAFYYRMATPIYHTLIIRSDVLVFHETTNGPFDRAATLFAPWAPEDTRVSSVVEFMADLQRRVSLIV